MYFRFRYVKGMTFYVVNQRLHSICSIGRPVSQYLLLETSVTTILQGLSDSSKDVVFAVNWESGMLEEIPQKRKTPDDSANDVKTLGSPRLV